jgi:hypothetical protein
MMVAASCAQYRLESPFSTSNPCNSIAPEADCKTKGKFVPKKPAFAAEKPGDLLPSLPRLPHRELSKSIAPTPIHPPLPSVIRFAVFAVGHSVCPIRQQRDPSQHC